MVNDRLKSKIETHGKTKGLQKPIFFFALTTISNTCPNISLLPPAPRSPPFPVKKNSYPHHSQGKSLLIGQAIYA